MTTIEEAEKAEGVVAKLDAHFPYIICSCQFLEVLPGNCLQFFNQFEHPEHFSSLVAVERVQEFLDWTNSGKSSIKDDRSHVEMLTYM